ncbi:MAG TPA: DUF1540 domain-containing protein [Symbiobacteriaceae bacterium]|nr:DUF1540 domain-containing protein [Symbiobacteriaceae bacterium]
MANQEIFCSVNSCYYYGNGDVCKASKIMVRNNAGTLGNTNMEIGSIGGEAGRSNQTLCETFIPKAQGPKPGIHRIDHER